MKKSAWYKQPQTLISVLVGCGAISSWVISQFVADAKQAARIEKTEEKVAELDDTVDEHEKDIEQSEIRQQLLQQDVAYIKKSVEQQQMMQQQILDAVKKK